MRQCSSYFIPILGQAYAYQSYLFDSSHLNVYICQ